MQNPFIIGTKVYLRSPEPGDEKIIAFSENHPDPRETLFHPENDVEPSETDKKITKQLCDAAKILGIQVIDHIIVTKNEHFGFQSNELLEY